MAIVASQTDLDKVPLRDRFRHRAAHLLGRVRPAASNIITRTLHNRRCSTVGPVVPQRTEGWRAAPSAARHLPSCASAATHGKGHLQSKILHLGLWGRPRAAAGWSDCKANRFQQQYNRGRGRWHRGNRALARAHVTQRNGCETDAHGNFRRANP